MTALVFGSFGGEMPSVSPRVLPADTAQVNENLFLATKEFRPLATDEYVAPASAGAQSLHRFARTPAGGLNTDPAAGWVVSPELRSYVKGQINDDLTERTYFSTDDGSQPLRAIDVNSPGAPRLLGVPAPAATTATAVVNDELTPQEAYDFFTTTGVKLIHDALKSGVRDVSNSVVDLGRRHGDLMSDYPMAGPYSMAGLHWCDDPALQGVFLGQPYFAVALVPYSTVSAMGLRLDEMKGVTLPVGGAPTQAAIPVDGLSFAYYVHVTDTRAALRAVNYPSGMGGKSGQRVLTDQQVESLIFDLAGPWFTADNYAQAARMKLEALFKEFATMLSARPSNAHDALQVLRQRISDASHEVNVRSVERLKQFQDDALLVKDWIDAQGGSTAFTGPTVERFVEERFYLTTFVTDWAQESAPSAPSAMLTLDQNDFATVARPPVPAGAAVYADRNITAWRIYRSNAGSQAASFQFVDEVPIATAAYTDAKKAAALGEPCPTISWLEPPRRASGSDPHPRGLTGMPNGIMAAFLDNMVAFCHPYVPYAWPVEYQITTEYPVTGLGVFGQTLFVGTTGNPYFISGADSASMSAVKLDARQACVSGRSIAAVAGGVLYASPDGLCAATPAGVQVVTASIFTREDWQKLEPASMRAQSHEGIYYLFYDGAGGGCLSFDLASAKLGRVNLAKATALCSDTLTDTMYLVPETGGIYAAFHGDATRVAQWRSPVITLPKPLPMAWVKVYGEQSSAAPATVQVFADGALRSTTQVTSLAPMRLPPGRWLEWDISISSQARFTRVVLAGSTTELQSQ